LLAAVLLVALVGCGRKDDDPAVTLSYEPADSLLDRLAAGLAVATIGDVPFTVPGDQAQAQLDATIAQMNGYRPEVTIVSGPTATGEASAEATFHFAWTMTSGVWEYDVTVPLTAADGSWRAVWSASLIHPDLNGTNILVYARQSAERAGITGNGGAAIVEQRPVVDIGIDKTAVDASQWASSARQLATIVGIDPEAYVAKVEASGPVAYVQAVVLRQEIVPPAVGGVPGVLATAGSALLAPSSTYAQPMLGTIGDATAEDIADSPPGVIAAGDIVGHSGIQHNFDAVMRGIPGETITLTPLEAEPTEAAPGDATAPRQGPTVAYRTEPIDGATLSVSLDVDLQTKAEEVLAGVPGPAAAVLIRPSDGAVLAAANSPASNGQPDANFGNYAPGSTFKIVTSLALLRKGYTPDSTIDCPAVLDLGTNKFSNFKGYPTSALGKITLRDAVAFSCNTAFMIESANLSGKDFQDAAASLGLGIDYTTGANVNFGTVPDPGSTAQKAQESIGQGGVLVSPIAMAGVVASVASGKTTIPWIVAESKPASEAATPLTETEASQLREMMAATVTTGGATNMRDVAVGAKTGTAEYGEGDPLPTHAWMMAFTDRDLAAVVWVKDGESGSGTAGPLVKQLLS
jgi:cell division protein FtsI/penicillin-binding protein 2